MSVSSTVRLSSLVERLDRQVTPKFSPPPRFREADFDRYRPTHPSQQQAVDRLVRLADRLGRPGARRGLFGLLPARAPEAEGIYLDGGFGVGKTHLLAATYHAAAGSERAYLSFQELVHHVGVQGISAAGRELSGIRLLLLDEFELDDPGNTLIVKKVLETLFEQGTSVVTTSNTPAGAQGEGRFNAEDFRREIQGIAGRFESLRLDGPDYRVRNRSGAEPVLPAGPVTVPGGPGPVVTAGFAELITVLRDLHPAMYPNLLELIGTLVLDGVTTIDNQNDALRFVHFIDRLYDRQVSLSFSVSSELAREPRQLFHPSYRDGAYQKKHDRCISRLLELSTEAAAGMPPAVGRVPAVLSAD